MEADDTFLLYGNIASFDIEQSRKILGVGDVFEVKLKENDPSVTEQMAVIVYVRYEVIDHEKGKSLFKLLENPFEKMMNVVAFFKRIGKTTNFIAMNLMVYFLGKFFTLLVVSEAWNFDQLLKLLDNEIEVIAESSKDNECVKVSMINGKLDFSDCSEYKDLYMIMKPT